MKASHTLEDLELIAHERLQAQPGCENVMGTRISLDAIGHWAIAATAGANADLIAIAHGQRAVEGELSYGFPVHNDA